MVIYLGWITDLQDCRVLGLIQVKISTTSKARGETLRFVILALNLERGTHLMMIRTKKNMTSLKFFRSIMHLRLESSSCFIIITFMFLKSRTVLYRGIVKLVQIELS